MVQRVFWVFPLAILSLLVGNVTAKTPVPTGPSNMSSLPTIVVGLGDHVKDVKARSSMPVDIERLNDEDMLVAQEPNSFVYRHPEYGFTIPEARYVRLMLVLGRVIELDISPQVEYFNIDKAFETAKSLVELFEKSGWKKDPIVTKPIRLNEIRRKFETASSDPKFKHGIGKWRNGDEEMYAVIARKHRVGESYAKSLGYTEDKYLITIYISNKKLGDDLHDKKRELRRIDGYNGSDLRPLSSVGKKKPN